MNQSEPLLHPRDLRRLTRAQARKDSGARLRLKDINALAAACKRAGDVEGYGAHLAEVEPALSDHVTRYTLEAAFLPKTGKVSGAINVYRKLRYRGLSGEVEVFEKVYHSDDPGLIRLEWAYRHAQAHLPFEMPSIIEILRGPRLTVVLFAFRPFRAISEGALLALLPEFRRAQATIRALDFPSLPAALTTLPPLYQTRRGELDDTLAVADIAPARFAALETQVFATEHVLNHGDLHRYNISRDQVFYDWDSACFAPSAHDLGRFMAAMRRFKTTAEARAFLREIGLEAEGEQARALFFFLVYTTRKPRPGKDAPLELLRETISQLEHMLHA